MPQGPLGLVSTPYAPVSGTQSPDVPPPLVRALGQVTGALVLNRGYAEDAQGSVQATTDSGGGVTSRYIIDAWGNIVSGAPIDNPFSFGDGYGYWQDAALGLYYVRARWLNPQTGTWLSVDPVLSEPRYAYVHICPTMLIDPTGMQSPNAEPTEKEIAAFNIRFFNTWNHDANDPIKAANALSKNPRDTYWISRLMKMQRVHRWRLPVRRVNSRCKMTLSYTGSTT
jgi:RHS repeat-associated protein